MSDIDLFIDRDNSLTFSVAIEGSLSGKTGYRLVMESPVQGIDMSFKGKEGAPGEVSFLIPPLKNMVESSTRNMMLEVIVDDRVFVPMSFLANLRKSVVVTAESLDAFSPVKKRGVQASLISGSPVSESPVVRDSQKIVEDAKKEKIAESKPGSLTSSPDKEPASGTEAAQDKSATTNTTKPDAKPSATREGRDLAPASESAPKHHEKADKKLLLAPRSPAPSEVPVRSNKSPVIKPPMPQKEQSKPSVRPPRPPPVTQASKSEDEINESLESLLRSIIMEIS